VPSAPPHPSPRPPATSLPAPPRRFRISNFEFRIFLLASLLALASLAGCGQGTAAAPRPSLTLALDANPTTLDPRLATDAVSYRLTQLLYVQLVRADPRGDFVPDLAERWEFPDDRTVAFTLRRGVRFHHGREVTAADVRHTFDSIREPSLRSPLAGNLEPIARIETPDPHRVVFRLKAPYAPFLSAVAVGIVPQDLAAAGHDLAHTPVGAGPFRFARWVPHERVELTANPEYFGGSPSLTRLVCRVIPDATTRLLELQRGGVDLLVGAIPPEAFPRLSALPNVTVLEADSNSVSYLGFNLEDPALKEVRVRRAIAHAVDRRAIVDGLLGGRAVLATGLLPPDHWAYAPDVARYGYDPAEARRLLAGATGPERGGRPLRLSYKAPTVDLSRAIGEAFQEQLAALDVRLDLRSYEWGTFYADIKNQNFQLYALSWIGIIDPDIYYYAFHTASLPPRGANRNRYRNPEVDRLLDLGRATRDREARRAIYRRVQQIVAEDLPVVPLWHGRIQAAHRPHVRGFRLYPAGDFISLKDVTLGPPR
jgi:peptide/nickel transport system substrate-binding protein